MKKCKSEKSNIDFETIADVKENLIEKTNSKVSDLIGYIRIMNLDNKKWEIVYSNQLPFSRDFREV